MTNILITGANRGLGLEFTRQYAAGGARIFACCRAPNDASALNGIAKASGGKVTAHALDVADPASIAALAKELSSQPLDILINNAGIYGPRKQSANDMDFDGWMNTFAVDTIAPFRVAQAFRPNLQKGEGKKLIAITSGMGSTPRHGGDFFAYRSAKAALNNVMHGLSHAWKDLIVAVIHPGWVKTDMGGKSADLEPADSISGMRKVIAGLKPFDSGRFFDYSGDEFPW